MCLNWGAQCSGLEFWRDADYITQAIKDLAKLQRAVGRLEARRVESRVRCHDLCMLPLEEMVGPTD